MTGFNSTTFGALYAEPVRNGLTRPTAARGDGYRMVNMGELFAHNRMSYQEMELVALNDRELHVATLEIGDLLFARSSLKVEGTGKCSIVIALPDVTTFESHIIRVRLDQHRADPRFYFYFFQSYYGRARVLSLAKQVGAAGLPGSKLAGLEVPFPSYDVQTRIADILSTYDDLIENNRGRMSLLEDAARELYREWFVRLRFPGHEHTPITDGMPEGWRHVRFDEVLAELESGGRPRGGARDDGGIPSIGAENVLGIGQYDYSKEKYVPAEYFERMTRGVVKNRDVVLYKDGANIGRASYFGEGFPHEKCAVNEHVFILRTRPFLGQNFLYFWMIEGENRQAIANLNANTAQPGISQEKLKGLRFLRPAERLTRAFNDAVEPQVRQIFALASMSSKLRAARDLLLPRLTSGEIAV